MDGVNIGMDLNMGMGALSLEDKRIEGSVSVSTLDAKVSMSMEKNSNAITNANGNGNTALSTTSSSISISAVASAFPDPPDEVHLPEPLDLAEVRRLMPPWLRATWFSFVNFSGEETDQILEDEEKQNVISCISNIQDCGISGNINSGNASSGNGNVSRSTHTGAGEGNSNNIYSDITGCKDENGKGLIGSDSYPYKPYCYTTARLIDCADWVNPVSTGKSHLSQRLMFKCIFLYAVDFLFHMEYCIRWIWCSSTILYASLA